MEFPQIHICIVFPLLLSSYICSCAPHSGEKLLFPSRHHLQLAPVALHSDAGKHLAGLDILLACSWMSYVSEPMYVIPFCMSFSASSELLG